MNSKGHLSMKLTAQQNAFIDALVSTKDHLALVARAGCGKTSTILVGVDAIVKKQPSASITVCAFNKAIAVEVSDKLKKAGHTNWKQVSAQTLHSMGFGLIKFLFKSEIDENKVYNIIKALADQSNEEDSIYKVYSAQIKALVGYAKQAAFGFFNDVAIDNVVAWADLAEHFDVNGLEDTSELDEIIRASQLVYRKSLNQTDIIDFDDMILFPLIKNIKVKFTKDYIFLDEAQDLSRARQALARKFLAKNGRLIVVGDDRQAIYGFSGADSAALPNLISDMNAKVLPLSITWRCPKKIVAAAQAYVPDIEAAETAIEGEIFNVQEFPELVVGTDAILCRNTAPLISHAYQLIRAGVPARVEGRSIGDGLIKLAGRWKVTTIAGLLKRLGDYSDREVQKARAKNNERKVEEIEDRVGTLVEICNACIAQRKTGVSDVIDFINKLFADGEENAIILATYHRSKGREWDRVFLLEHHTRCPSKAARKDWEFQQEANLAYVAITRAKKSLYYVTPE